MLKIIIFVVWLLSAIVTEYCFNRDASPARQIFQKPEHSKVIQKFEGIVQ